MYIVYVYYIYTDSRPERRLDNLEAPLFEATSFAIIRSERLVFSCLMAVVACDLPTKIWAPKREKTHHSMTKSVPHAIFARLAGPGLVGQGRFYSARHFK